MSHRFGFLMATLALLAAGPGSAAAQDFTHRIETMAALLGGSYLGVVIDDVGADSAAELKLSEQRGAAVREVEDDSPAATAGLQAGDVIVGFDGESVRSVAHLTRLVRETPADRTVGLEVWRDGGRKSLEATLKQRDHLAAAGNVFRHAPEIAGRAMGGQPFTFEWHGDDGEEYALHGDDGEKIVRRFRMRHRPLKLGISFQPLSGQLAEYFGVEGGVLISEVHDDTPASKAGLQAGDVIVRFDGKEVDGQRAFQRAVRQADPGTDVGVTVQRDGKEQELQLTVGGRAREAKDEEAPKIET